MIRANDIRERFEAAYAYYALARLQSSEDRISDERYWSALVALGDHCAELAREAGRLEYPADLGHLELTMRSVFNGLATATSEMVNAESTDGYVAIDEVHALPYAHRNFRMAMIEYQYLGAMFQDLAEQHVDSD